MVDTYGRWTYVPGTPEEKKCDCDRIADWITEIGYTPKISIEHLVLMILSHFDSPDTFEQWPEYGTGFTVESCIHYVQDSRGPAEFDYIP